MRILVTNDDGLFADGLVIAEDIARDLAGPDGDVWVAAPESEKSGVSHAISYTAPTRLTEHGPRRFAVDGTPADCVIVALNDLMPEPPDLVISGVNRGHNMAEDAVYSGTVGGAMEGALQGVRSIALSQSYTMDPSGPADRWDPAKAVGLDIVRRVLKAPWSRDIFYNVNFPAVPPDRIKGVRVGPQGRRAGSPFDCEPFTSPNKRRYHWLAHTLRNDTAPADSDAGLVMAGWVAVTPMRPDLTAPDLLEGARAAMETAP